MTHPLEEELIGLSLMGGDERSPGTNALSPRTIKRPTNPVASSLSANRAPTGMLRLGGADGQSSCPSDDGVTLDVAAKRQCRNRPNPAPAQHALFPPSQLPSPPCLSPLLGSGWGAISDAPPGFLLALAGSNAPSKTASAQASPVRRCVFTSLQPEHSEGMVVPCAFSSSMTGADDSTPSSPVALATNSISQSLRLGPPLPHNRNPRSLLPPSLAPSNAAFGGRQPEQSLPHAPPQPPVSYRSSLAPPPPLPMRPSFLSPRPSPARPHAFGVAPAPEPIACGGFGRMEKGAAAGEGVPATKHFVGGSAEDGRRASVGLGSGFAGMLSGGSLGGILGGSGAGTAGSLGHGGGACSGRARSWSQ